MPSLRPARTPRMLKLSMVSAKACAALAFWLAGRETSNSGRSGYRTWSQMYSITPRLCGIVLRCTIVRCNRRNERSGASSRTIISSNTKKNLRPGRNPDIGTIRTVLNSCSHLSGGRGGGGKMVVMWHISSRLLRHRAEDPA